MSLGVPQYMDSLSFTLDSNPTSNMVIIASDFGVIRKILINGWRNKTRIHITFCSTSIDPENDQFWVETNLPTLIWQGLC